jgi:hypothetical protein
MFQVFWSYFADAANVAETFANFILFFAAAQYVCGWRRKRFIFADGARVLVFYMRARDVNAQNMTNAVSATFFGGGNVSPEVRAQIIRATTPKIR